MYHSVMVLMEALLVVIVPSKGRLMRPTALQTLYLLDRFEVSDEFYHELTQVKLKCFKVVHNYNMHCTCTCMRTGTLTRVYII